MKKQIIYTNLDNQDFSLENYKSNLNGSKAVKFTIHNGCSEFYLLSLQEVDDFCDLLQQLKKEVFNENTKLE